MRTHALRGRAAPNKGVEISHSTTTVVLTKGCSRLNSTSLREAKADTHFDRAWCCVHFPMQVANTNPRYSTHPSQAYSHQLCRQIRMDRLLSDMLGLELDVDSDVKTYTADNKPNRCVCNKRDSAKRHDCKVFGNFCCRRCGSTWRSGNAWFNFRQRQLLKQECRRCGTANEPKQFHRLRISGRVDDGSRPHMRDKCEKCKQLGYDCSTKCRSW